MNIEMQEQINQAPKDAPTQLSSFADPFNQQVQAGIIDQEMKSRQQSFTDGTAQQQFTPQNATMKTAPKKKKNSHCGPT
jgi:hypothetical protein